MCMEVRCTRLVVIGQGILNTLDYKICIKQESIVYVVSHVTWLFIYLGCVGVIEVDSSFSLSVPSSKQTN